MRPCDNARLAPLGARQQDRQQLAATRAGTVRALEAEAPCTTFGSSTARSEDAMPKVSEPQFIESTAGEVAAELARRGIRPDQHVTVTVEPDDWLAEVRKFARPRVVAKGWSDADVDRIIEEEREAVQSRLG
jgi:hypothetical protein